MKGGENMTESFLDVGQQVLVLFILIGVGAMLTKAGMITEPGAKTMTDVVLYAVTPCVIINAFQREFRPELLGGLMISFTAALLTLLFSVLVAELLYRRRDIDRGVVLRFTVVFSNCGFMALPLQEAVLGADGVFYGAAYIAVFNLVCWTYGLIIMSQKRSLKAAVKAVLNPGVLGTLMGVVLFLLSAKLPSVIASPVKFLAGLNTPVPMLVIGYHLMNTNFKRVLRDRDAYVAMTLRLIVLPLLTMGVMLLCGADGVILCATVIAVSAPAAAATTMMAAKFGRDAQLSTGIVSASSLVSVITMPLVVGLARYLTA